jgi:hypothetical protein
MHEPSITHPWDECPWINPPSSAPLSAGSSLDEPPPLPPTAVGCLSQRENLLGLWDQKTKGTHVPIPHESTVGPTSCTGMDSFTSHGPLGMPQNATRLTSRRLSQNCAYVPAECVFSKIYQKTTPPLTPNSPPQQKGPNKKKTSVNDRELPTFQVPCLSLRAAFPSSLIHFTWVLTLSHESICCLTGQFFC